MFTFSYPLLIHAVTDTILTHTLQLMLHHQGMHLAERMGFARKNVKISFPAHLELIDSCLYLNYRLVTE